MARDEEEVEMKENNEIRVQTTQLVRCSNYNFPFGRWMEFVTSLGSFTRVQRTAYECLIESSRTILCNESTKAIERNVDAEHNSVGCVFGLFLAVEMLPYLRRRRRCAAQMYILAAIQMFLQM